MSIFVWCKSFELGVELLDEHHKHLVDLLNKVFDCFVAGESYKIVEPVIDELIDYAKYHFAAEEYWMEYHKYPKLKQHGEEHEWFYDKIMEIQKDNHNQTANQSLKILTLLKNFTLPYPQVGCGICLFLQDLKNRRAIYSGA